MLIGRWEAESGDSLDVCRSAGLALRDALPNTWIRELDEIVGKDRGHPDIENLPAQKPNAQNSTFHPLLLSAVPPLFTV